MLWRSSASGASTEPPAYGGIVLSNSVSIQRVWIGELLVRVGRGEGRVGDDRAVEGRDGRHALDDELVEGAAGPLQGLLRVAPVTMSLASIESNAPAMVSPSTAGVPADAGALRDAHRRDGARGGQEAATGVLAVDPELDGVGVRLGVVVADLLAVGDAELLAHQVDAGDLLGDRVLDLQAGVDLEEGDVAVGPTRNSQVPAPT
jgi:hypothetical protein